MHKVKKQRSGELFVKNIMVIIKNYKVKKKYLTNLRKD